LPFYNIAIVLGLPALLAPGAINALAFTRDYGVMLGVSALFALLCWRRAHIGKRAGAGLLIGFVIWMALLYWGSSTLIG